MRKIFGLIGLFIITVLCFYVSTICKEDIFIFDIEVLLYCAVASVVTWLILFIIGIFVVMAVS